VIGLKQVIGKLWNGTRSISTGAMARFLSSGADGERVTKPMEQVGAVNRCIRMRASAISSMPLMVSTTDDQIVESGEIMDLLSCPWPGATSDDLVGWIDALMMLTGACNVVIEQSAGKIPNRLRPVGQDRCKPQYDQGGELVGYRYFKPGDKSGRPRMLEPDEVIPFTLADYQSQKLHDGLSQLKPTMRSIQQVFAADTANLESLYNGVEPGLVFDFGPNTTPTDEQVNQVYRQLDENHRSPSKRNNPLVIGGGASVNDFVKKFTEMEFTKLKSMSVVDVCVSLGVPPLVAGYSGEAGMGHGKELEEAHTAFQFITVLPAAAWIARKLTIHLLPRFQNRSRLFNELSTPRPHEVRSVIYRTARRHARQRRAFVRGAGREPLRFFAWFDSSAVDAVRDAALRRLKEATILTEKLGATQAEVIEAYDAPVSAEHPWQQTWWKPMGLVDVREDTREDEPPPGNPDPPAPDPVDEDQDEKTAAKKKDAAKGLSEKQLAALHDAWWLSIMPLIRDMRKKVEGHFRDLRAEVNRNINRAESKKTIVRKDLVAELLFDLVKNKNRLRAKARPLVRASALLGGSQSMEDAAIAEGKTAAEADPYNIADPRVKAKILARENRITGVDDTVHRRLKKKLATAVADGKSLTEIREVVRVEFNFASERASTIARTEIGAAVEESRHEGRRQAGIPLKSWLWSRRETGREWHMRAEDQTHAHPIAREALFTLPKTGNTCQHPRVTNVAEDDINCGCTTLSRFPDDRRDAELLAYRLQFGFTVARMMVTAGGEA